MVEHILDVEPWLRVNDLTQSGESPWTARVDGGDSNDWINRGVNSSGPLLTPYLGPGFRLLHVDFAALGSRDDANRTFELCRPDPIVESQVLRQRRSAWPASRRS